MKKDVTSELLALVRGIMRTKTKESDTALLKAHYLDEGLIDSFELVEMLATVEKHFNVRLSAAELTSEKFRTLAGVAGIIESNLAKK